MRPLFTYDDPGIGAENRKSVAQNKRTQFTASLFNGDERGRPISIRFAAALRSVRPNGALISFPESSRYPGVVG